MTTIFVRDKFKLYTIGPFTVNEDGVSETVEIPQTHMVGYLSVTDVVDNRGDVVDSPTLDVVVDAVGDDGNTYELDAFAQVTGVANERLVADLDPILDQQIRVRWDVGRTNTRGGVQFTFTVYLAAKASQ